MFGANIWRTEPFHTGCYCSGFRSAGLGGAIAGRSIIRVAIVHLAVFSINIERSGFIVWRYGVIACYGGFVCCHSGNEHADFTGSFGIARQPGADSRGGA
jgi:hypothetical protein